MENILENFRIIVLERDNDNIENIIENNNLLTKYKNSFIKLENIEKIDLGSSYIREIIKAGNPITAMVPEEIESKVMEVYK